MSTDFSYFIHIKESKGRLSHLKSEIFNKIGLTKYNYPERELILFDYDITFFDNDECESLVCNQSGFELSIGLTQLRDNPDEIDGFSRLVSFPIVTYITQKVSELLSTKAILETVTIAGDQPTLMFDKGKPAHLEIDSEIEEKIKSNITVKSHFLLTPLFAYFFDPFKGKKI